MLLTLLRGRTLRKKGQFSLVIPKGGLVLVRLAFWEERGDDLLVENAFQHAIGKEAHKLLM
jgi:hypothetical protein